MKPSFLSLAFFAAAVLCFFFSFASMSSGSQKVRSITGLQLVFGMTVEQPQILGVPKEANIDPDIHFVLAGLAAVLGIGISLFGPKYGIWATISGGAGAAILLALKVQLDAQVAKQGVVGFGYENAFYMALLLLISGATWNAYRFIQQRTAKVVDAVGTPAVTPNPQQLQFAEPPLAVSKHGDIIKAKGTDDQLAAPDTSIPSFCEECGGKLDAKNIYCENCGVKVG